MPQRGINQDTLSNCRGYSDPYDSRYYSHPAIIKNRAQDYQNSRDVLETPQKRLEKELLLKLLAQQYRLSISNLVIIVKFGKFALFVLTYPAYLFCYGVPKWMLAQLLPIFFKFGKNGLPNFLKKGSLAAHKFLAVLKSFGEAITSPILAFIKTQIDRTEQLFSNMKEAFTNFASDMKQKVLDPINSALANLSKKMKLIQGKILEAKGIFRSAWHFLANAKVFHKINAIIKHLQAAKTKIGKMGEFVAQITKTVQKATAKALNRLVYKPLEVAKEKVARLREKAQQQLERITEPVKAWISPKVQRLTKTFTKGKERVARIAEKIRERMKRASERVDRTVKATAKEAAAVGRQLMQIVPIPVISFFLPIFNFSGKVVRLSARLVPFGKKIKEKLKRLKEKIKSGCRFLSSGFNRGMAFFGGALWQGISMAETMLKKTHNFFRQVLLFLRNALKGALFLLRLMLASIRVLLKAIFILLRGKNTKTQLSGEAIPISVNDAHLMLKAAQKILFVPGYGATMTHAQKAARLLSDLLGADGKEVSYAVHPSAGRKSGSMKVKLEKAGISKEQLVEPKEVNKVMSTVDVCLVIGANDVVNTAARDQEDSPIFGMPIINADEAKSVIVLKRSLEPGFSGVENPLFSHDNTRMVLGNPKAIIKNLIAKIKK